MNLYQRPLQYFILAVLLVSSLHPRDIEHRIPLSLGKTQIHDTGHFNGNQIVADLENNGMLVSHRLSGHSGLEWPAGSEQYSLYAAGMWYAGKVSGEIRTMVAEYAPEGQSGPYASDADDLSFRLYKINISDLEDPESNPDFAQWPVHQGAPWVDVDGDGLYTPMPGGLDHPEFIGDQVIFYVYNDGDSDTHQIFNTDPLGIEVRVTIWGYNNPLLENSMFIKQQIYNKGGEDITDMYAAVWSDPDLGNAGDDYVGCDPNRNLGFCYNDGPDPVYGANAPALGFNLLQVAVPSADPSAEQFCFGSLKSGYRGLSMTSFFKYIGSSDIYSDPNDRIEAYNYMQGLKRDGTPVIDPTTGLPSRFVANGDPLLNVDDQDAIWVDGDENPSDDRRMLMGSGPFDLSAGDSAEVIVAIMIAQGSSSLSSLVDLRYDAENIRSMYENDFAVPTPPLSPEVEITVLPGQVILTWDDLAESYSSGSLSAYEFEGYNIYQYAGDDSSSERIRLATYDLKNSIFKIWDYVYDDEVQEYIHQPIQFGTDSGIQRYFQITENGFQPGSSLIDGRAYYFSVTAYGYNGNLRPSALESEPFIHAVRPGGNPFQEPVAEQGDTDIVPVHEGLADATVKVGIIDPLALTGDTYEVYFDQQHYYLNADGRWVKTNYPDSVGRMSMPADLSGTVMTAVCMLHGGSPSTYDLRLSIHLQNTDAWSDGFMIDLPDELVINSWTPVSGNYGTYGTSQGQNIINTEGTLSAGNIITWGDHSVSEMGAIEGDVEVTVNINESDLPFDIYYEVWDDGFDAVDVDVSGSITITEVRYEFLTIPHWNLKNAANEVLIEDQTTFGTYQYNYVDSEGVLHEGHTVYTENRERLTGVTDVGINTIPIIDGFQLNVTGSFQAPAREYSIQGASGYPYYDRNGNQGSYTWDSYSWQQWAPTSRAIDVFGVGSTSLELLGHDYEFRWTGEYTDSIDINQDGSQWYHPIKAGTGAMATWVGARNYVAADHPMNRDGDEFFQIRIPFEVWNLDTEQQVSVLVYDRTQQIETDEHLYAFNPNDRVYIYIWNEPYLEDVTYNDEDHGEYLTWNLISWESEWVQGDVMKIIYKTPIQLGLDRFTFTTQAPENLDFDLGLIKAWPNPYFAQNPEEESYFDSRIHFINLPEGARITILNLAGQVVRVLEHGGGQELVWDVRTAHNNQVASGVYIAIVETEYGKQVLKLAVVARKI